MLILTFLATNVFGQNFGAIVFPPGTSTNDEDYVRRVIRRVGSYGNTGDATESYVTESTTDVINMHIGPNFSASVSYRKSTREYHMYLNSNRNQAFLSNKDYEVAKNLGEVPQSADPIDNAAIVLGHEFAHIIPWKKHSQQGSTRFQRESDAILNYENDFRAAVGLSPRTTYGGKSVTSNKSWWQSFKRWWKKKWE